MQIIVDTLQDSPETIARAIELLGRLIETPPLPDFPPFLGVHRETDDCAAPGLAVEAAVAQDAAAAIPPPPPTADGETIAREVDSAGVVYDPTIHSSSRAKNKDGTWRNRRGGAAPAAPAVPPPPPAVDVVPVKAWAPPPPPADAPLEGTGPAFRDIVKRITQRNLPKETVQTLLSAVGVESLTALIDRPALFPEFLRMVEAA